MSLSSEIARYVRWLGTDKAYSPETVRMVHYRLGLFGEFARSKEVLEPGQLARDVIEDWTQELAWRATRTGRPIKTVTRSLHLSILRGFLHFLFERNLTLADLAGQVVLPKRPRKLPGEVLEHREVLRIIERTDTGTPAGLRDRAIVEVLYSSALRVSELSRLRLEEVDHESGLIYVREGKGGKDRVVPLGAAACEAVRTYLLTARSDLLRGPDPGTLLLNLKGRPMTREAILRAVKGRARRAGIARRTTPHSFRRTCATLMLRDGADIRNIQEMLGHESLNTTALYLKLSARNVKKEHEKHHPREKPRRRDDGEASPKDPEDTVAESEPVDEEGDGAPDHHHDPDL